MPIETLIVAYLFNKFPALMEPNFYYRVYNNLYVRCCELAEYILLPHTLQI
jgi:hypothetical protein